MKVINHPADLVAIAQSHARRVGMELNDFWDSGYAQGKSYEHRDAYEVVAPALLAVCKMRYRFQMVEPLSRKWRKELEAVWTRYFLKEQV